MSELLTPSEAETSGSWWIYNGQGHPHDDWELPPAPPWRRFTGTVPRPPADRTEATPGEQDQPDGLSELDEFAQAAIERRIGHHTLAETYRAEPREARLVNAAICLRRPLLVTGKPGTGKSTLAYSIAYELGLGPVLSWPITSRSTLQDGLYRYDAIGRLQEVNFGKDKGHQSTADPDIGSYVRLGPLGTALLPRRRPRVLLIDEIDKSDIDLPNDLLAAFEEGEFTIPELARLPEKHEVVGVMTADQSRREFIRRGEVRCFEFPIVILTSNGERDFPPAFLRRCIRLDIKPPGYEKLTRIVSAHLGADALENDADVVNQFLTAREERGDLATDQLLNALHMATSGSRAADPELALAITELLRPLNVSD
jgi:MoxR-like ATPase